MWHLVQATLYDPSTGKWEEKLEEVEGNDLHHLLLGLVALLEQQLELQDMPPLSRPQALLIVGLEISSWHSYKAAATRDMEANRTLQQIKTSLGHFLSSGDSSLPPSCRGISNGSSPS